METDLRILKTKKALYEAAIDLMKEKSFEELKVSDICHKAMVNRSTFYAHYTDKYELLIDYINSLKNDLEKQLESNSNLVNSKEYYLEMIRILLDHIDSQKDIYRLILLSNRNGMLLEILENVAIQDINKRLKMNTIPHSKVPYDVYFRFYLGAILGVGFSWLKGDIPYTKEEMLSYFETLIPED